MLSSPDPEFSHGGYLWNSTLSQPGSTSASSGVGAVQSVTEASHRLPVLVSSMPGVGIYLATENIMKIRSRSDNPWRSDDDSTIVYLSRPLLMPEKLTGTCCFMQEPTGVSANTPTISFDSTPPLILSSVREVHRPLLQALSGGNSLEKGWTGSGGTFSSRLELQYPNPTRLFGPQSKA